MTEDYLHLIWRTKRLPFHELTATECDDIEIIHVGEYNTTSGPDFFNAKIRMNDAIHHGNVELHIQSSDWYKHQHQQDEAYNNVILHVVLFDDKPLEINGVRIPTIELHPYIDQKHLHSYLDHVNEKSFIPCEKQLDEVDPHLFWNQVGNALYHRLERKTYSVKQHAINNQNHAQKLIFQYVFKAFGFKVNNLPFLELANRLPFTFCLTATQFQLESLLFGIGGFLNVIPDDPYTQDLIKEWTFLKHKFKLSEMNITTWKFKGCRPNGFPTIRLAQLASFIKKMNWNIDFWEFTANEIISFLTVELRQELPKYWQSHYHFSKLSTGTLASSMSRNAAELVIINSVVPFLGWYSDYVQNPKYQLLAIEILELLPKENNHTITSWKQFGKIPKSAAESQGLLELKNEFCTNKKCLDCKIGLYLLGK